MKSLRLFTLFALFQFVSMLAAIADIRIKTEWKTGNYGLNLYDVEVLYKGAKYYLKTGRCQQVLDGDKSLSKPSTYWINCGGPRNIFFKLSDIPVK